ncbi:MAG TPA: DUF4230 domain-containing protein [Verrucomicrobiae bacterium]|jgi:hypothetical protein
MWKFRLLLLIVLVALAVGVGMMVGARFAGFFGATGQTRTLDSAAILQQVQSLSQLVTVKYVLQKAVGREEPAESVLGKMFTGESRVVILAHGVVKAGVDLQRLQPGDLQVEGTKITIRLPPPQIFDVYLDDEKTEVLERSTGLFRPFDKQLEQTVRAVAVDDLRRAARNNGILKEADDRARDQLRALLRQLGFAEVEINSQ